LRVSCLDEFFSSSVSSCEFLMRHAPSALALSFAPKFSFPVDIVLFSQLEQVCHHNSLLQRIKWHSGHATGNLDHLLDSGGV